MSDERAKNVMIYVVGLLDELKSDGLVAGGHSQLSDAGRAEFQQLKAAEFRPTDDEVIATLEFLNSPAALEAA